MSCAFGAIVLLLVIMKISEPSVVEDTSSALEQTTVQLQEADPGAQTGIGRIVPQP